MTALLLPVGMLASSFVSRWIVDRSGSMKRLAVTFIAATGLSVAAVPGFRNWLPLAALVLAAGFCAGVCSLLYQLSIQRYSAWHAR